MATTVTYVGNQYSVPAYNDTGYAQGAGNLSSYLVALATGSLTLSGGSFPLTADVNFGTNFGLISLYYKSTASNLATAGVVRLANTDTIAWRNVANNANLALAIDGSNNLTYNGNVIAAFGVPLPIADGGTNSTTALTNGFLMSSAGGKIVESAVTISTAALGAISSITSSTANAATAGFLRLANTEGIDWRNNANNANIALAKNASDQLSYAGNVFLSSAGIVPVAAGGTNSAASLNNNRVIVSSGSAIVENAIGTTGQFFKQTGASTIGWASLNVPTVQKFTTGSGTYTTPTSPAPLYIQVIMVGGGGGGSGSGLSSGAGGSGGTGGNTTFGTTLLVANGGTGGTANSSSYSGGTGGTASLGSGPIGTAAQGGTGSAGSVTGAGAFATSGGTGAYTIFSGGGAADQHAGPGIAAIANSGAGGGGGSINAANAFAGSGGAAGGYVDAIIGSPAASYSYAVGAAGSAGTGGTSGSTGGAGGSGYIEVREFYQ